MTNRELMLSLIEMFNCTTVSAKSKMVNAYALNEDAMRVGYFVQPEACTQEVQDFINSLNVNYNSTFYKTWEDVTSRSRFDLFIESIDENFAFPKRFDKSVCELEKSLCVLLAMEKF